MYNEVTFRFDALNEGVDGEGEHEGAGRIPLLGSLLAAEVIASEA